MSTDDCEHSWEQYTGQRFRFCLNCGKQEHQRSNGEWA